MDKLEKARFDLQSRLYTEGRYMNDALMGKTGDSISDVFYHASVHELVEREAVSNGKAYWKVLALAGLFDYEVLPCISSQMDEEMIRLGNKQLKRLKSSEKLDYLTGVVHDSLEVK